MTRPAFAVPVSDLERGEKTVSFTVPESWLRQAFAGTDAEPRGDGVLEVELRKTGRSVMVRGHASAEIHMPCVVTLDPLPFSLKPEIFLLLSPDETAPNKPALGRRRVEKQPVGPKKGRSRGHEDLEDGAELSSDTAAKDTYDGETVVLDGFLREFLVLELPLYPRRADLPSDQTPAIAPPSPPPDPAGSVDPRLQPLAAIAKRLEEQNKE